MGAIKALVQAGADVNRATKDGRIPAELLKIEMSLRNRNEMLKLLGESVSRSEDGACCLSFTHTHQVPHGF